MDHPVQWVTASPFWGGLVGAANPAVASAMRQPALLRFATDSFMEDLLSMVQTDPSQLAALGARPETWRDLAPRPVPAPTPPLFALSASRRRLARSANGTATAAAPASASAPPGPLKLYQPAHQRYYLLSSCLVCQQPGLPDRALNTAAEESVSFVVRRLLPRTTGAVYSVKGVDVSQCDEYAFVNAGGTSGWRKVPDGAAGAAVAGEELQPLFPVGFTQADGRPRRIFAGLVPVGRRESYVGAPTLPPGGVPTSDPNVPASDPRIAGLLSQVVGPWRNLVQRALAVRGVINPDTNGPPVLGPSQPNPFPPPPAPTPPDWTVLSDTLVAAREQIQTVSWYVLLDFSKFLQAYLPDVWNAVIDPTRAATLSAGGRALLAWLSARTAGTDLLLMTGARTQATAPVGNASGVSPSLREALIAVGAPGVADGLEAVTGNYQRTAAPPGQDNLWPTFLFPLADPMSLNSPQWTLPKLSQDVDALTPLVVSALPAAATGPTMAVPLAAQTPADPKVGWFVLRCLYDRPTCGPLDPPVVSDPTVPFQMAAYFDPDAPARPLRIVLPIDTSPAGLRGYDKNAAFMISDVLCNQLSGISGLTLGDLVLSVLPFPFHKDLNVNSGGDGSCATGVGSMCSFSLPIITICAMIILLIFVKLLDIAMFWMAFFRICLPVPKFGGKD